MKNNKRLIANIVEIAVGIVLTVCGYTGMIDEYWSGMGTALVIVGGIMLIRQIRYRTNMEYKSEVDVQVNDERNKYLHMKAWSWAGYFFVLVVAVASIILKIVGLDQLSQFSGLCVCVLMNLYWISYLVLSKRN